MKPMATRSRELVPASLEVGTPAAAATRSWSVGVGPVVGRSQPVLSRPEPSKSLRMHLVSPDKPMLGGVGAGRPITRGQPGRRRHGIPGPSPGGICRRAVTNTMTVTSTRGRADPATVSGSRGVAMRSMPVTRLPVVRHRRRRHANQRTSAVISLGLLTPSSDSARNIFRRVMPCHGHLCPNQPPAATRTHRLTRRYEPA